MVTAMRTTVPPDHRPGLQAIRLSGLAPALLVVLGFLLGGCATRATTQPAPMALAGKSFPDGVLAIMPLSTPDPAYYTRIADSFHRSWFPRTMYGSGEVTTLVNHNDEFALALYNRIRGCNVFNRAVIVKDRAEADQLGATHMIAFHISECYAAGRGSNWNFIEWLTYEGVLDVNVVVYDLAANQRIQHQKIHSTATTTSPWSSPDVRDFIRRKLLTGVTFHNAIAQMSF